MANKKITELTELTAANIANNDVLAIVDVGGDETKKVAISSLYDIFDNNVTIDTAKIVYGLTGANTNISALSVNTLPLIGGTITGPVVSYSINSSSNVSIAQSLAIGYVDHRIPQANLDVKDNVYIGGATTIAGALTLGTDLAVAQGGTGASSLTDGGVLLGSGTSAITAMGVLSDGEVIVGDGTTDPVAESGATLRTSIGVGTGDSPQFTAVNIGAATDTTVARASAGDINVEGNLIYRAGGTDVPVADGGTGASSLGDGGVLFGSGTSAVTFSPVLTDGVMVVGDGSGDPVLEGNTALRTSIGVGTGDTPQFYGANVSGNASINRSLAIGYTDGRIPQANLEVKGNTHITGATTIAGALTLGTDLAVAQGGTGASSFTDGGVLLGSGTSAVTAMGVLSDGQMIVGDGSTDPVAESGATLRTSIGVGTGDIPQFYGANITGNASIIRNLVVGYANDKVPGANLDVNGNAYISTDLRLGQDATIVRDASIGRNLVVSGNLTVKGNNFIVHANNLVIDDPIIALAANLKSSQSPADDTGLLLNRGSKSNVFAGYDESSNSYVIAYTPTTANSSPIDIGSYSTTRVGALTADSLTLGSVLTVGQGGTGATSLTDGGVLLGSGTGAITALGVLGDGELIVGDGTTDPVAESGATLRTSIGVGTGDTPQFYGANVSGNASINRSLAIGYTDGRIPQANLEVKGNTHITGATTIAGALTLGTDLAVAQGGTGASTLGDGHVLLGSGTSAITTLDVTAKGSILAGDGSGDPRALGVGSNDLVLTAASGETTGLKWAAVASEISAGDVLSFYSANTTGNVSLGRGLAVGYVGEKIPGANLDVNGNVYISGATTIGGALAVTEIDSASTITLDAETDIILDAKGGDIYLKDNGTIFGTLVRSGGNLYIKNGSSEDTVLTFANADTDVTGKLTSSVTPSFNYGANVTGNVSVTRSIAVGYTDGRVPQANLEVKGNTYISGATTIAGALTLGTDLAVAQGGTGASSLTDGGVLLGSGTSAITAMGALGDGEVIVGDGSTDPVAESGDTLRISIGVGSTASGTVMQVYSANASGNVSVGRSLAVGYTDGRVPQANLEVKGNAHITGATTVAGALTLGTQLAVAQGGTGATSLTDGGVLLGSGTGAITALGVLGDGEFIVGDGTTDPVAESGSTLRTSIGVGTGDSPQFTAVNIGAATDTTVSRASAGDINVEGNLVYRAGGTDVPVADGGTGASSFTDGHVLLGSGTGAITALNVTVKGSILAGDGSTDPQALAVGDNDQVLTADSDETTGLKWADASGSGGGYFKGSQTTGSAITGPGDIFRINRANLNANVTILAYHNASCTGPLTILTQQTLTINGTAVII